MKTSPNIKVKRKSRGRFQIVCSLKQAKAIACLLNCSCTRYAANVAFPGAFHGNIHKPNTWDAFAKAGIASTYDMPDVHCYPTSSAKRNGWKFPIRSSNAMTDAIWTFLKGHRNTKTIPGSP